MCQTMLTYPLGGVDGGWAGRKVWGGGGENCGWNGKWNLKIN